VAGHRQQFPFQFIQIQIEVAFHNASKVRQPKRPVT
jgi:hypothetical protein